MADMPSDFWSGWIALLTVISFAGLGWLIFSIYFGAGSEQEHGEGPTWDENLREGSNPAPMWWFWLILSLMVLTVLYLMLYPGLGSFKGALRWSQGGRLDGSIAMYETEFGSVRELIAGAELVTLRRDPKLMRSAQRIYDRNCAVCHGYEAQGQANLFPSLVDDDWQWGASPAQVEQSIRGGRNAVMVGWAQILGGEAGVQRMVEYVRIVGSEQANGHPADTPYKQFCAACHGVDGSGNVALGAPTLTDDIWLYGDSDAALTRTLTEGRAGIMPAFGHRLDDTQIRLLVALLLPESAFESP